MFSEFRPAILITIVFTILTGLLYPLAVTGMAQAMFQSQANGSLVEHGGKIVGSAILGQAFTKPEFFHPRPAANSYDATNSGGSNLGPTNPALIDRLTKDAAGFRNENPEYRGEIPSDAIAMSGSGLDPDISPANAMAQAARVAGMRRVSLGTIQKLISDNTHGRVLGFIGEPTVNVLKINLALEGMNGKPQPR